MGVLAVDKCNYEFDNWLELMNYWLIIDRENEWIVTYWIKVMSNSSLTKKQTMMKSTEICQHFSANFVAYINLEFIYS